MTLDQPCLWTCSWTAWAMGAELDTSTAAGAVPSVATRTRRTVSPAGMTNRFIYCSQADESVSRAGPGPDGMICRRDANLGILALAHIFASWARGPTAGGLQRHNQRRTFRVEPAAAIAGSSSRSASRLAIEASARPTSTTVGVDVLPDQNADLDVIPHADQPQVPGRV